jgi:hypothetical protein
MKRYAYAWITVIFFLVSIAGHWMFGWYAFLQEAAEHAQQAAEEGVARVEPDDMLSVLGVLGKRAHAVGCRAVLTGQVQPLDVLGGVRQEHGFQLGQLAGGRYYAQVVVAR